MWKIANSDAPAPCLPSVSMEGDKQLGNQASEKRIWKRPHRGLPELDLDLPALGAISGPPSVGDAGGLEKSRKDRAFTRLIESIFGR